MVSFVKDCKEDITNKYQATDLTNVEITFDDKEVDYTKAGEYTANVFAKNANDNDYAKQYLNGTITFEEYHKKSPYGYECWSCSYCGKWTGNFKYR